jgi:hypothetical protein
MDAPWFTGDDTREDLAPDPEERDCEVCGARPEEPCAFDCACERCERDRAQEKPEARVVRQPDSDVALPHRATE